MFDFGQVRHTEAFDDVQRLFAMSFVAEEDVADLRARTLAANSMMKTRTPKAW